MRGLGETVSFHAEQFLEWENVLKRRTWLVLKEGFLLLICQQKHAWVS